MPDRFLQTCVRSSSACGGVIRSATVVVAPASVLSVGTGGSTVGARPCSGPSTKPTTDPASSWPSPSCSLLSITAASSKGVTGSSRLSTSSSAVFRCVTPASGSVAWNARWTPTGGPSCRISMSCCRPRPPEFRMVRTGAGSGSTPGDGGARRLGGRPSPPAAARLESVRPTSGSSTAGTIFAAGAVTSTSPPPLPSRAAAAAGSISPSSSSRTPRSCRSRSCALPSRPGSPP